LFPVFVGALGKAVASRPPKLFQQSLIRCPEALKDQQNALPGRNPSRLKSMAAGQKPVNADCIS